jgi:hypothetical protein
MGFEYVCTGFENASPAEWAILPDGSVRIDLIYDHPALRTIRGSNAFRRAFQ